MLSDRCLVFGWTSQLIEHDALLFSSHCYAEPSNWVSPGRDGKRNTATERAIVLFAPLANAAINLIDIAGLHRAQLSQ